MSRFSPLMTVIDNAARKAARALRRDFNEVEHLQVSKKGPADFVSAADRKADQTLREELLKARPQFGFLTEEGEDVAGDGVHRWIIDPLDGTTNFLHGLPHFSISIAVEKEGEIVAGYVYQPLTDEIYWAERAMGAFSATSGRLRVSARKNMEECLFAVGAPFKGHGDPEAFAAEVKAVTEASAGVRRFGVASLDFAYVAAGRFDGFWERGLKPWDVAAGLLLVREAGGYVIDENGKNATITSPCFIAGNAATHLELKKVLDDARGPQKPRVAAAL